MLDIEPVSGTVTVGPRAALAVDGLTAIRPRWCGAAPEAPLECTVQLRAHGDEHRAVVTVVGDSVDVHLLDPASGIAPGQAVVVYDGTRVVGSATIDATRRVGRRDHPVTDTTARATGVGSMPGEDFAESLRMVLDLLPDLPHLPELPARGAIADLTGRAVAITADLGFDLQPAGWRLTDAPGVDHRRARSRLAQDLDVLEEQTQGYAGPLKVQVAGPWTLASTIEKPRGDKVLSDHGARRELAQALAEGVRVHLADVQRRVPGAELVLQVDEPALPVRAGRAGADGLWLQPAPHGAPARGVGGPRVGLRGCR